MKVYLVMHRHSTYDNDEVTVDRIFDSEEKAKQYIEATYSSFTYDTECDVWLYEDTYTTFRVWFEEWEAQ